MGNTDELYPLKFIPILKPKVWGGDRLFEVLDKKQSEELIGESWELSGVPDNVSVVANGSLHGKDLNDLIDTYGPALLGNRVMAEYGNEFPLLFKFIDARQDLSVQLHPDDELARERHDSFGKTEMWYIVDTDPEARLIIGFDREMDKAQYESHLAEGSLVSVLNSEEINPGDAYFIAPGTVHAIGGGTLLAEIQQTSDITYRIYDWDRPDVNGSMRELHTELALDAINYKGVNAKLQYRDIENDIVQICRSDYFETNKLKLTEPLKRNRASLDSFSVYMCLEGEALIESESGIVPLQKGESVLIPACIDTINVNTGSATLLEIYIP